MKRDNTNNTEIDYVWNIETLNIQLYFSYFFFFLDTYDITQLKIYHDIMWYRMIPHDTAWYYQSIDIHWYWTDIDKFCQIPSKCAIAPPSSQVPTGSPHSPQARNAWYCLISADIVPSNISNMLQHSSHCIGITLYLQYRCAQLQTCLGRKPPCSRKARQGLWQGWWHLSGNLLCLWSDWWDCPCTVQGKPVQPRVWMQGWAQDWHVCTHPCSHSHHSEGPASWGAKEALLLQPQAHGKSSHGQVEGERQMAEGQESCQGPALLAQGQLRWQLRGQQLRWFSWRMVSSTVRDVLFHLFRDIYLCQGRHISYDISIVSAVSETYNCISVNIELYQRNSWLWCVRISDDIWRYQPFLEYPKCSVSRSGIKVPTLIPRSPQEKSWYSGQYQENGISTYRSVSHNITQYHDSDNLTQYQAVSDSVSRIIKITPYHDFFCSLIPLRY